MYNIHIVLDGEAVVPCNPKSTIVGSIKHMRVNGPYLWTAGYVEIKVLCNKAFMNHVRT